MTTGHPSFSVCRGRKAGKDKAEDHLSTGHFVKRKLHLRDLRAEAATCSHGNSVIL